MFGITSCGSEIGLDLVDEEVRRSVWSIQFSIQAGHVRALGIGMDARR
jgi:hypothetical protein